MLIRTVSVTDLNAVQNLVYASFDPFLGRYMISMQRGAQQYMGVFVEFADFHLDRYLLLAESASGDLLGFADFRLLDDGIGFLSNICVAEIARGQGVAKNLILRCLDHFSKLHTMQLDVFENNYVAKSLYKKLGFQDVSNHFWLTRCAPEITVQVDSHIAIQFENLPFSLANYEKYGFCELNVSFEGRRVRFGRLGENILRCFQPEDYINDMLLKEVKYGFPSINEVFVIVPTDYSIDKTIANRRIVHSTRMSWDVSSTDAGRI